MNDALLVIHEVLCLVLIYTVFCRFVRTDDTVRLDVRMTFFLLGAVACFGIPAPFYGFIPNIFSTVLLFMIVMVQVVTSRYWRNGVPLSFYSPECMPCRRSTDIKPKGE